MNGDVIMPTVLAVPCNQPVVLTQAQGEQLLFEINARKITQADKERIVREAKILLTKPGKK